MITGENSQIFYRPEQFKAYLMPALLTDRKSVVIEQSGFVHQPVRIVSDPINAALRNQLSRNKLFAGVWMCFHSINLEQHLSLYYPWFVTLTPNCTAMRNEKRINRIARPKPTFTAVEASAASRKMTTGNRECLRALNSETAFYEGTLN